MDRPLSWVVVGVGRAGRARCRALVAHSACRLVAVHRGRFASEFDVPILSDFASIPTCCNAVVIASPDQVHASQVAQCLDWGLHVICEFPLALDTRTAAALFARARSAGRILHVGHISLLTKTATTLRSEVNPRDVSEVCVQFSRPGPVDPDPHDYALRNIARLHRLLDVAGDVKSISERRTEPGGLLATGILVSGGQWRIHFSQRPDARRHTRITLRHREDIWVQENRSLYRNGVPSPLPSQPGLFAGDLDTAVQRILRDEASYVSEERILRVLELAGRLDGKTPDSRLHS